MLGDLAANAAEAIRAGPRGVENEGWIRNDRPITRVICENK